MGRRTRGRDLWFGLALQGSFFEVPDSPKSVWMKVWAENLHDFRKESSTVSGRPIRTPSLRTTSPFFLITNIR